MSLGLMAQSSASSSINTKPYWTTIVGLGMNCALGRIYWAHAKKVGPKSQSEGDRDQDPLRALPTVWDGFLCVGSTTSIWFPSNSM